MMDPDVEGRIPPAVPLEEEPQPRTLGAAPTTELPSGGGGLRAFETQDNVADTLPAAPPLYVDQEVDVLHVRALNNTQLELPLVAPETTSDTLLQMSGDVGVSPTAGGGPPSISGTTAFLRQSSLAYEGGCKWDGGATSPGADWRNAAPFWLRNLRSSDAQEDGSSNSPTAAAAAADEAEWRVPYLILRYGRRLGWVSGPADMLTDAASRVCDRVVPCSDAGQLRRLDVLATLSPTLEKWLSEGGFVSEVIIDGAPRPVVLGVQLAELCSNAYAAAIGPALPLWAIVGCVIEWIGTVAGVPLSVDVTVSLASAKTVLFDLIDCLAATTTIDELSALVQAVRSVLHAAPTPTTTAGLVSATLGGALWRGQAAWAFALPLRSVMAGPLSAAVSPASRRSRRRSTVTRVSQLLASSSSDVVWIEFPAPLATALDEAASNPGKDPDSDVVVCAEPAGLTAIVNLATWSLSRGAGYPPCSVRREANDALAQQQNAPSKMTPPPGAVIEDGGVAWLLSSPSGDDHCDASDDGDVPPDVILSNMEGHIERQRLALAARGPPPPVAPAAGGSPTGSSTLPAPPPTLTADRLALQDGASNSAVAEQQHPAVVTTTLVEPAGKAKSPSSKPSSSPPPPEYIYWHHSVRLRGARCPGESLAAALGTAATVSDAAERILPTNIRSVATVDGKDHLVSGVVYRERLLQQTSSPGRQPADRPYRRAVAACCVGAEEARARDGVVLRWRDGSCEAAATVSVATLVALMSDERPAVRGLVVLASSDSGDGKLTKPDLLNVELFDRAADEESSDDEEGSAAVVAPSTLSAAASTRRVLSRSAAGDLGAVRALVPSEPGAPRVPSEAFGRETSVLLPSATSAVIGGETAPQHRSFTYDLYVEPTGATLDRTLRRLAARTGGVPLVRRLAQAFSRSLEPRLAVGPDGLVSPAPTDLTADAVCPRFGHVTVVIEPSPRVVQFAPCDARTLGLAPRRQLDDLSRKQNAQALLQQHIRSESPAEFRHKAAAGVPLGGVRARPEMPRREPRLSPSKMEIKPVPVYSRSLCNSVPLPSEGRARREVARQRSPGRHQRTTPTPLSLTGTLVQAVGGQPTTGPFFAPRKMSPGEEVSRSISPPPAPPAECLGENRRHPGAEAEWAYLAATRRRLQCEDELTVEKQRRKLLARAGRLPDAPPGHPLSVKEIAASLENAKQTASRDPTPVRREENGAAGEDEHDALVAGFGSEDEEGRTKESKLRFRLRASRSQSRLIKSS